MFINSAFAFFVPVAAREGGLFWLCVVRFIQGLGEGPIVPCTHALLAKWIPPNERSRVGAAVYSGAQFGTVISMPLSGLLAEYGFDGGWPSIFYIFGLVGVVWSLAFVWMVSEDPDSDKTIDEKERKYISNALWGAAPVTVCIQLVFFYVHCNHFDILFLAITTNSVQIYYVLFTFLCNFVCPHGSKLRLRNFDDRITVLYEPSLAILIKSCKILIIIFFLVNF